MKSAELKKTLEGFEKMELIRLIIELAKLKKYNMEWLEIEFQKPDEPPELLEYYKKKISRALDSNDLTAGKKAIGDFKKTLPSRESLIDIMIFYVEQGTEITLDCGDMYEDFYTRLESVYIETIKLLNKWEDTKLIEKFRPRLEILVNKTEDVGWGYHDVLWDWYDELGTSEKEE
jgi:hypothetical protein